MRSDRPGVSYAKFKGSYSPHSLSGHEEPTDTASEDFAKRLIRALKVKSHFHQTDEFTIVSEPSFAGLLKKHYSSAKINTPIRWVLKDIVSVPKTQWRKLLGFEARPIPAEIGHRFSL
jgi:protein required for attachment to host cells